MSKYDEDSIWTSANGIFYNVQNVLYKKQSFSKYEFINKDGTRLLVGYGVPFIEEKIINKADMLYDAIKLCENCDFITGNKNYFFSDDEEEKIIKFVNKYGFPLISVCNDYIGESPTYTSSQILKELEDLSVATAARLYLNERLTKFKNLTKKSFECKETIREVRSSGELSPAETSRINNTWAMISIIDYMYSASYKYLPEFSADIFKKEFEYNLVAFSVFDVVRLQFCQLLNADDIGICEICHKSYKKAHGNSKYCPNCKGWNGKNGEFTIRVADKKYKENIKKNPSMMICKKYMDRYRNMLGAQNEQYKIIRDKIIEIRKKALNEKWSIEKLQSSLDKLLE